MDKIEVKFLYGYNFNMPKFLAKLTQRGHEIESMEDIMSIHESISSTEEPSDYFMESPHTTLRRMNPICIAVSGLSTKCVSQLRTHAKRLTFLSTSTQYSSYINKNENFGVIPSDDPEEAKTFSTIYKIIFSLYDFLIDMKVDKDKASYILPQGLRKALIIYGNVDDWQYVMKTRLCHRNSYETQMVMKAIYKVIKDNMGEQWVKGMLPPCANGKCEEGKLSCGRKFNPEEELL